MKKQLVLATLIASLGATAVLADNGRGAGGRDGRGMPEFSDMDTNGDGAVTLAEINAIPATRFAAADADGNGTLSVEEVTAMIEARASDKAADYAERMISRMDDDKDGVLSVEEMSPASTRGAERMFSHIDADSDGNITQAEFDDAKEKRGGRGKRGDHRRN